MSSARRYRRNMAGHFNASDFSSAGSARVNVHEDMKTSILSAGLLRWRSSQQRRSLKCPIYRSLYRSGQDSEHGLHLRVIMTFIHGVKKVQTILQTFFIRFFYFTFN